MMKIFSLFALFLLSMVGYSQERNVTIKGTVGVKEHGDLILCSTTEGRWEKIDTAKVAGDGSFSFSVTSPKSGIWGIVSTKRPNYTKPYYVKFYLTNEKEIHLTIGEKWTIYTLDGKLGKENKLYQKWISIYDATFIEGQTYLDLYPKVDALVQGAEELKSEIKGVDNNFKTFFCQLMDYDISYGLFLFRYSPNRINPKEEEVLPIYAQILKKEKLDNDFLLETPYGGEYVQLIAKEHSIKEMRRLKSEGITSIPMLEIAMKYITSNKLKAIQFMGEIGRYRTYEDFIADYDKYGKYLWSENQKKKIEAFVGQKKRLARGEPAPNFTFPDVNGKMVSLSDFKGKVVLVDVWATWCGPCKEEIPHLIKLEKEMHGQEIVFIGVSVDTQEKKQAWLDMIQEKGLKGVQLFVGAFNGSEICKDYEITSIPRFMVFDKDGKIYSMNAPRPSDNELKVILQNLLKQ